MRKFNYLMSFIALGAVLTSCQKEELEVLGSPDTDGNKIIISATTPTSDTKVSIDEFSLSWEMGDEITIAKCPISGRGSGSVKNMTLGSGGLQRNLTIKSVDGNKAVFSGEAFIGSGISAHSEYVYGIYPKNGEVKFMTINHNKDNRRIRYDFAPPMAQDHQYKDAALALDPSSISPYVFMYGQSKEPFKGKGNHATMEMSMKHLMTYFDFNISGLSKGTKVDSLVITTPELFASKATYNCYPMDAFAINEEYVNGITYDDDYIASSIVVKLLRSDGTEGVLVPSSGELTVRVATCISQPTTGTVWTIKGYSGNILIGTGGKLVEKEFEQGFLYDADITLDVLDLKNITVTKVVDVPLSTTIGKGAMAIADLTITGGLDLDVADFKYISNMANLTTLDISATAIDSIPVSTFVSTKLSTITLPSSLLYIGRDAFFRTDLASVTIPKKVKMIDSQAFRESQLATIIFESGSELHTLASSALRKTLLTEVVIPKSVTTIGLYLFNACSELKTITFEEGSALKKLSSAFASTSTVTTINLPEGLDTIGNGVFNNYPELNNVVIPSSVRSLGTTIFNECLKLTTITFEGATPPTIETNTFIGSSVKNTPPIVNIYVPNLKVTDYENAQTWIDHVTHSHGNPASTAVALTSLVKVLE